MHDLSEIYSSFFWPNPKPSHPPHQSTSVLFPSPSISPSHLIDMPGEAQTTQSTVHSAFTVSNIKNVIPLILNRSDDHYPSWVEFFNIHVCANNVKDHIDDKTPKPTDVDKDTWDRLDALVKSRIYITITLDLAHTIMKPGASALDLWKRLQEIFLDNKNTRAVYLEEQFNNTHLSAFSNITEYCSHLKNLADQLENVGNPVSETKMVLQLISGLTKGDYDTVATIIQQTNPFPSFTKAESSLLLEEARRNKPDPTIPQAFVTQRADCDTFENSNNGTNNHNSGYNGRGQNWGNQRGSGRWSCGRGRRRSNGRFSSQQTPWKWPGWFPLYPWSAPPCPYPTVLRLELWGLVQKSDSHRPSSNNKSTRTHKPTLLQTHNRPTPAR
ncbi:uncharacterized protein LOC111905426 [Lactuca sativa]|uniref:uncharacterized protein LOC111905426 n=1 Tax=Lactuca sativa TaxID=4236 RepID=UPI0022AF1853|nr:uncharacterized protein LOC111905426 [Lactuca sativa]